MKDSASLGSGAKAGITIGVIIGCVLLGTALWFFYRHRKQPAESKNPRHTTGTLMNTGQYPSELAGREKPAELGSPDPHELADASPPNSWELAATGLSV